uniref:FGGY carbohydrate kinase domain-containing protein n=1 Tax=Myxine glutinosa TaxID=7769 RepID=UPI00358F73E2
MRCVLALDVGSSSVRAAIVSSSGALLARSESALSIWAPSPGHYEQSSSQLWAAACIAATDVMRNVASEDVCGVAFDGTCSLVVLDDEFQPLPVNDAGIKDRNMLMWMDHRAGDQAKRCRGGLSTKEIAAEEVEVQAENVAKKGMSLEMHPPRLMWLKENLPDTWKLAGHFMDLPDFLTWKATGNLTRSLCCLLCKWGGYQVGNGWNKDFWESIGLPELTGKGQSKIGLSAACPGRTLGALTPAAAIELGVIPGIPVAVSLIDAHAGGLGVVGADVIGRDLPCEGRPITSRLAIIAGTSTCHMAVSEEAIQIGGVWGPFHSAMVPGLWLHEAGQSATGSLINHIVSGHPAYKDLQTAADTSGQSIYDYLNEKLMTMVPAGSHLARLTSDLHIWPDFHGNRSPESDPDLRGMIVGLNLSHSLSNLSLQYLACIQALALGTRHILRSLLHNGYDILTIFMCGGLSRNRLYAQCHADATGLPVVLPANGEGVLTGTAILAATAANIFPSVHDAMRHMSSAGEIIWPNVELSRFYDKKFSVFLKLLEHQREYRSLMSGE